jgi:hypothetical protein
MEPISLRDGPWDGEPADTLPETRVHYNGARDRGVSYMTRAKLIR